jgi:hypothetical protein
MDIIDTDGDRIDDRNQAGPGQPDYRYPDGKPEGKPIINEGNNPNSGDMSKNNGRIAGGNFGLSPTEVVETSRGRGYGLTFSPQQRGSKTTKFGGRSIGNIVNFNPILSQQQNPNINVNASPTTVAESGPGGVSGVTGSTGPLMEMGRGNLVSETGPGDQVSNIETGQGNLVAEEGPGDLNSTITAPGTPSPTTPTPSPTTPSPTTPSPTTPSPTTPSPTTPTPSPTTPSPTTPSPSPTTPSPTTPSPTTPSPTTPSPTTPTPSPTTPSTSPTTPSPSPTTPTPSPTTPTPSPTTPVRPNAGMKLRDVTLKNLNTGVTNYDSPSDAKNILAALNKNTAARGKNDPSKIGDKKINRLISQAGISNFDSKRDAKQFTNFLIDRAKDKRDERRAAKSVIQAAKKVEPDEGEKSIMRQVRKEIKQQLGEKPTKKEVRQIVRRADVGKKLNVKDLGKIRRAARKAKKKKNK